MYFYFLAFYLKKKADIQSVLLLKKFNSLKEYEEKAVSFALNRPKLKDLRNRLEASRLTCPLFDTARWVCHLYHLLLSFCLGASISAKLPLSYL